MNFLFRRKLRIVSFSPSLLLSATTKPGCQPGNGGDKKERERKKRKIKKSKTKTIFPSRRRSLVKVLYVNGRRMQILFNVMCLIRSRNHRHRPVILRSFILFKDKDVFRGELAATVYPSALTGSGNCTSFYDLGHVTVFK